MTERIILDCDPGHDDALAMMLAAGDPRVELVAVTTCAGNQTVEKVTRNALSVPVRDEMFAHMQQLIDDKSCRAIILTGAGGFFCSRRLNLAANSSSISPENPVPTLPL